MRNTACSLANTVFWASTVLFAADPGETNVAPSLSWQFAYDDAGRVTRAVDPGGKETKVGYKADGVGRGQKAVAEFADGSKVTAGFDRFGRRTEMTDAAGVVRYGYDQPGRLTSVRRDGAPALLYTRDTVDRVTSVSLGEGLATQYSYDFLGRLAAIDTPAGKISYEYQTGQRRVIRTLPNGIRTVWEYYSDGGLKEVCHVDKDDRVLLQFTYAYRPDGLISGNKELSRQGEKILTYEYDNVQRLTAVSDPSGSRTEYRYDKMGNRTELRAEVRGQKSEVSLSAVGSANAEGQQSDVSEYDWAGRLIRLNERDCTHDAAGNLTSYTGKAGKRVFEFDARNRLKSAQSDAGKVRYEYDGDGNLLVRETGDRKTEFIPDPTAGIWRPLLVTGPDGGRTLYVWEGDVPLATIQGKQSQYFLHDHLGSVRAVADERGRIVTRRYGSPFGEMQGEGAGDGLQPGLAGLFWDETAGLYLTRARGYDAALGRFLQPDPQLRLPSGSQKDLSPYSYCGCDPVGFVDRDGGFPLPFDDWTRRVVPVPPSVAYVDQSALRELSERLPPRRKDPVDVLVGGITMREEDTTKAARRFLGPNAVGIPVDYGMNLDLVWAAANQATGGRLTRSDEKLWQRLSANPNIGRLEIYSHGAIVTGNLSDRIDRALTAGALRIGSVTFYGVNADKHLVQVLEKHHIPWNVRAEQYDPVRAVTTPNAELGGQIADQFPAVDLVPFGRHMAGAVGKAVALLSSLPGIPGPYSTAFHGLEYLHKSPSSADERSNVGGIYLRGAGDSLKGLGRLSGVAVDRETGRLVLLAEDDRDMVLPPLRMDDVVTVFRSVYIYGHGPTVTIDPNPEDPEKSAMVIRHDEATANTYAGWVLYQADRLMKGYNQGVDNITANSIVSRVPGYEEVLEKVFFGGDDPRQRQKGGIWERFWIVPAAARRFDGPRRELTLLDVPVKVRTQKMRWEGGKLVDDPSGASSTGAVVFSSWFTTNYDGIAAEQFLVPPQETGITNPVPVFEELRRIVLLTAVAEKLRDQGVPMPFWMREHDVRKIGFERFTPGLEVTRRQTAGNVLRTARIFGGVETSVDMTSVKTYAAAADAREEPKERRTEIERAVRLSENIEKAVADARPPAMLAPLTVQRITEGQRTYQAVSIPGAETRALGPCRLDEADIVVPVVGGRDIALARRFNSFFSPRGPFGRGWALDLPYLQETRTPVRREGEKVFFKTVHELLTPLNSLYARFREMRPVAEAGGGNLLAPDSEGPFLGLADARPDFLKDTPTRLLLLKNGEEWHFTMHGDLVAVKQGPQITVYERDREGRVTRIVALMGGAIAAKIELSYSGKGLLSKAVGAPIGRATGKPVEVFYTHDTSDRLTGVGSDEGTVGYEYQGQVPLVVSVNWTGKAPGAKAETLRAFAYNDRGQLTSEKSGALTMRHAVAQTTAGMEYSRAGDAAGGLKALARYDRQMRPVETVEEDGARTEWSYRSDGGVETVVARPDGLKVTVTDSSDGRRRTVLKDGGPATVAQFDAAGRLVRVTEEGRGTLTQQWRSDGQLARVETDTQGMALDYDRNTAVLRGIVFLPPKAGQTSKEWQEIKVDRGGNPVEITDCGGLNVVLRYDESGALVSAVQKMAEGNMGFNVERENGGRVKAVKSSWGDTSYRYSSEGRLERIETRRDKASSSVEFSGGLVCRTTGFDGGVTTISRHDSGPHKGRIKGIRTPNDLALSYDYDAASRIAGVTCGDVYRRVCEYDGQGRLTRLTHAAAGSR